MANELTTPVQPQAGLSIFQTSDGQRRMISLADEFRSMCAEKERQGKKWLVAIGPGRHATIEAWQYIGQRVGVCARTVETKELRNPMTGEFEGVLAISDVQRLDTGEVIGRAEQVCYADEVLQRKDGSTYRRWDGPDGRPVRHSIIGMAQTRAQSRALASVLRFLLEMAGVEGTPAEEMDGIRKAEAQIAKPQAKATTPPATNSGSSEQFMVLSVEKKTKGEGDQKKTWYVVKAASDKREIMASTYSETFASVASESKSKGFKVAIETVQKGQYLNIKNLEPIIEADAAPQE